MEALYAIPFHVLEVPNLKLKKPGWVKAPSAMVVFAFVLLSYFLVTGGKYVSFFIALPRRTDQSDSAELITCTVRNTNFDNCSLFLS